MLSGNSKDGLFVAAQYQTDKTCNSLLRIQRTFDDFKNKQKSVSSNVFLICKGKYVLKVYSIYYEMLKKFLQTK